MKEYQIEQIRHTVEGPLRLISLFFAKLDFLWGKLSRLQFVFVTVDGKRITEPCKVFVRMCDQHDPN